MDKLNFSFRDYISYMLPGALVLFSGFLINPTGMDWLESHKFVSGLVFLLGGYIVGSFLNGISYAFIINKLKNKLGSPNRILSGGEGWFVKKLDGVFEKQLKEVLVREWGEDLVNNGSEPNLLLLCLRKSQTNSHPALDTVGRLVSLHEFYAAMIIAIPISSTCLIFAGNYLIGILILPLTYRAVKGFYTFRRQFVVNVYRIFFIQHREKSN